MKADPDLLLRGRGSCAMKENRGHPRILRVLRTRSRDLRSERWSRCGKEVQSEISFTGKSDTAVPSVYACTSGSLVAFGSLPDLSLEDFETSST